MKTIIAAVDSSERSRAVYKETLVLAVSIQAKVVVVSVTPEYEGNMNRFCIENAEKELNKPFLSILKDAAEYAESLGLDVTTVHKKGTVWQEILAVAQEYTASLIVLGCTRRSHIGRLLLGRTVAEIIAHSECDVMLMPEKAEIRFAKIAVGISDSIQCEEAVERALAVNENYGSEIHCLHAVEVPPDKSLRYGVASEAEGEAAELMQKMVSRIAAYGVTPVTTLGWNSVEKSLYNYCIEKNIDLVILGAPSENSIFEYLGGSVAEKFTSLTACPVLIACATTKRAVFTTSRQALDAWIQ